MTGSRANTGSTYGLKKRACILEGIDISEFKIAEIAKILKHSCCFYKEFVSRCKIYTNIQNSKLCRCTY